MTIVKVPVIEERVFGVLTDMLGPADALRKAKEIAGKTGHIMAAPEVIDGKIIAPFKNELWTEFVHPLSEEFYGLDKSGNKIYGVSHPARVLSNPERIERITKDNLLPYGFARLTDEEFNSL